jgi:hypothetical protein
MRSVEVRRRRTPRGDGEMRTDSSWALVEVRRRRKPRGEDEMRTDSSWALGHKSVVTARSVRHGWVWVWVCQ